jgi:chlorobactene glucosyltransferase
VTLDPNCLGVVLHDAISHGADMETLVLGMDAASAWEGAVQPYAGTLLMMIYPVGRINAPTHPGWGNGQFILVDRATYDLIGQHTAVKDKFVEDIHLGRATRQAGRSLRVAMASRVATVRMYSSLDQILRGWARIFYSAVDFRPRPLWLLLLATFVFSVLSYVVLVSSGVAWLAGHRGPFVTRMFWLGVTHELLQLFLYARIYVETRTPLRYLPLRPFGVAAMIAILLRAIRTCRTHDVQWRGTSYGKEIQEE